MEPTEQQFLDGVETAENAPIVLSRYGFKKIQLDGKTYLTPQTEQEYMDALTLHALSQFETGAAPVTASDINPTCADDPFKPACYTYSMGGCKSNCCKGRCVKVPPIGNEGWECYCQ